MTVDYQVTPAIRVTIQASNQRDVWRQMAELDEVFGVTQCEFNKCGSTNLIHVVRSIDGNDYFEMKCRDCGSRLAFGQNKQGGSLFPKRKIVDSSTGEEKWDHENHGWGRYVPTAEGAVKPAAKKGK